MIRIMNVTQHYGVRPVLKNVSIEIPAGSRTAVIGPNGMGKTTLLNVMAGVLAPQHGFVEIDGLIRRSSVEAELEIRRHTVFLPDRSFLPQTRTGREFLLAVGKLYEVEQDRIIDHAQRLLDLFELTAIADSPIRTYSAGQQKKIALSSAIITDARTLLLDEPFSGGLDPAGILALRHLLQRLAERQQRTVVMTSPVPELVTEIADRIIIIRSGEVVAYGTLEEIQHQSGSTGSFSELLQKMVFPEAIENVERYFAGETP
ncbi:ABC transporter ATP-binding protein [Planctomicrobium piriforme]|uniref:ABC transporter ATP-binding protein n=1 Tax=Planctomicrobium piriforme TaxID=1576369 RepID=UPI0015877C05|nr:ABC transporter ATP-binding protein [Planctomicrobium piriforme]